LRRIITFIAFTLIAWIGYEIYAAGKDDTPPPSPQDIVMHSGKAHGERISTPSWSIEYDNVVGNADQTLLNLEGVHNGVFYRNGKPYLHMHAKHMTVNTTTHDFSASGPFHVETVDRKHFRALDTTEATWNQGTKRLFLPVKTIITTTSPTKSLTADNIIVDVDKSNLHMEHLQGTIP
jgi:hypothetical protein